MKKAFVLTIISSLAGVHGFLGHAVGSVPMGTTGRFKTFYNRDESNNHSISIRFYPDGQDGTIEVPASAVHIPSKDIFSENYEE